MGFLGKLFNGPGTRVEETIRYLVNTEINKVKYYLSHKENYNNYNEYCQSRTCMVNNPSAEQAYIEDSIIFETVLRVFRKMGKKELIENRDFNYKDQIVGIRIYDEEVGHIIIESFLTKNRMLQPIHSDT